MHGAHPFVSRRRPPSHGIKPEQAVSYQARARRLDHPKAYFPDDAGIGRPAPRQRRKTLFRSAATNALPFWALEEPGPHRADGARIAGADALPILSSSIGHHGPDARLG